jgi:hypothetical protein
MYHFHKEIQSEDESEDECVILPFYKCFDLEENHADQISELLFGSGVSLELFSEVKLENCRYTMKIKEVSVIFYILYYNYAFLIS